METQVSSSYIGFSADGQLETRSGRPFVPAEYSRMKYGSQLYSRRYGLLLAMDLVMHEPGIVLSSAPLAALITYKHVPSAAATLTRAAVAILNDLRHSIGLPLVDLVHVQSGKVLGRDYSSLSQAERQLYIGETGYSLASEAVEGKNVLVIDDVRNTGAAENLVRSLLADKNHLNVILAYLAVMDQHDAVSNPKVENLLNTSCVTDLDHLLDICKNDGMTLTIRTMKMILGEPDPERLEQFLLVMPIGLLYDLYEGTLGSGPEFISHYETGLRLLRKVFHLRSGITCPEGV